MESGETGKKAIALWALISQIEVRALLILSKHINDIAETNDVEELGQMAELVGLGEDYGMTASETPLSPKELCETMAKLFLIAAESETALSDDESPDDDDLTFDDWTANDDLEEG